MASQTKFCGTMGQTSFKTHKTGTTRQKQGLVGSPPDKQKYSQTSVHELNSFLNVIRKPKLFSP